MPSLRIRTTLPSSYSTSSTRANFSTNLQTTPPLSSGSTHINSPPSSPFPHYPNLHPFLHHAVTFPPTMLSLYYKLRAQEHRISALETAVDTQINTLLDILSFRVDEQIAFALDEISLRVENLEKEEEERGWGRREEGIAFGVLLPGLEKGEIYIIGKERGTVVKAGSCEDDGVEDGENSAAVGESEYYSVGGGSNSEEEGPFVKEGVDELDRMCDEYVCRRA
ncbi:hypothetical protein CC78DRAFT_540111 [Lojkania enalia]|uniref:Uncharacterized protein n=1 Tax=Lojkania enalia TaxID=147567 RepID=A0A9P4TPG8_9PLEO|nr:hypothetical protein CC78DRAFT_540111 [Didymosphaeria enalia]